MIVDGFLFCDELDLLKCRLATLDAVVDKFVLCESTQTFTGEQKPLYYAENKHLFGRWNDRIIHVVAPEVDDPNPWEREWAQRDALSTALGFLAEDDTFMLSDVDEIPRPEAVIEAAKLGKRVVLDMRFYSFAIDWQYPKRWPGTIVAPKWALIELRLLRYDRDRMREQGNVIEDGGWHFSWLGDTKRKLHSFAHTEIVDKVEAFGLERCYREGWHVDGVKLIPVTVNEMWPKWMWEAKNVQRSWFRPPSDSTFTEDWFADDQCEFIAGLAEEVKGNGRIVEIGCWEGRSTVALANAVYPEVVHAVDTWQGSPGEISEDLAKGRDVLATFKANIAALTQGNVAIHQMDWRDYCRAYDSPIKFCHIDATHTYKEVRDNIEAVWPLIIAGGVLCGDDATWPEVKRAAMETLGLDGHVWHNLWFYKKGDTTSIRAHYEEMCERPSDINEHLPYFRALAMEADKVIELGTRVGLSTVAFLSGVEASGGHVWSVDLDGAPSIAHPQWTFVQGDDRDPSVVRQLPNDADIVFIDTSHAYEHTLVELRIYRWRVKPGGVILLHDTEVAKPAASWTDDQPLFPVKAAVQLFCREEGLEAEFRDNNYGLGIIKIPE